VTGRSDIEGKATRLGASERGQWASFKEGGIKKGEKLIRNPGKQEMVTEIEGTMTRVAASKPGGASDQAKSRDG